MRGAASSVELPNALREAGFNACGALAPDRYDALVPESWRVAELFPATRSVLVIATGGTGFFRAFAAQRARSPDRSRAGAHPLDGFADARLRRGAQDWSEQGFETRSFSYWEQRGEPPEFADFVALGRACGLGTPSRLGLLIHPEFGPWMAIRAVWLTARELTPTAELAGAGPCDGCPAPCHSACPVSAPSPAGFDALACRHERDRAVGCRTRCDARRACVVGCDHAYSRDAETHHMLAIHEWDRDRRVD